MIKKHFWKIVALVVIILVGASIVYSQKAAKEANEGIVIEPHVKGNLSATVELVEYSDFQCPACGQFYPFVKEVMDQYGDKIRFEYRHFPLITVHPYAVPAAAAAEAAGQQGKFWEMHDKLFENQTTWSKSSNPSAYFIQYAEEIGLDGAKFKKQMNASIISDAIDKSFNDARTRGFASTPTFLLNGQEMNFSTFEDFRSQIEAAVSGS